MILHFITKLKSKTSNRAEVGSSISDINAPGASTRPNQKITAPGE